MTLHLFRCVLTFVVLLPLAGVAQTKTDDRIEAINRPYFDARSAMQDAYRKSLAKILEDADKIEVFLLDFEMQNATEFAVFGWDQLPSGFFPIMPYGNKSKILGRKTLSPEEMKMLLPVLRENVGAEKNTGGAFCHYPVHGVRVWSEERLIFQSSFCWHCGNFYVPYPDQTAGWEGISTDALGKVMKELMPIPAKEIARFEQMNKPKPKPKKK